jgi:hypothetical protein
MSTGGGGLQVRRGPLLSGAALIGVGGLIALVGVAVGGFHLLSAFRQWAKEMEVPPSELAKQKLAQARAAAAAGADAWQNAPANSRASVSLRVPVERHPPLACPHAGTCRSR